MINALNCDSRVGRIRIDLNTKWNDEIVEIMISRYSNLYSIVVIDHNNSVYHMMHGLIKQWV